jgi:5-formyltetrahydrofolate cyclo-ligase
LRELALRRGKVVYMAVPRLRRERCFIRLDPTKLRGIEGLASTIRGAFRHGKLVAPWEMERIDLVVAGVVAVNEFGEKVGKSGGYTDLEFAIGREFGIIAGDTPVITTVHELQLVGEEIPQEKHDVSIDLVVTPKRVVRTKPRHPKPKGIYWDLLDEEKLRSIPILRRLAR